MGKRGSTRACGRTATTFVWLGLLLPLNSSHAVRVVYCAGSASLLHVAVYVRPAAGVAVRTWHLTGRRPRVIRATNERSPLE